MCQLSPVTFHGDTIFCIDYQNQPYTPAKSIVENLGLGWASQSQKLNANKERWGITIIVIPSESGDQQTLCLPVRKLPAYLASINPKKVHPELRPKIELYQAESDDALWNYWMNGRAERYASELPLSHAPLTPDQQCTLQAIVKAKVEASPKAKRSGLYPRIWGRFNNHFRLAKYAQLPQSRLSEAVTYLTMLEMDDKMSLPPARLPVSKRRVPAPAPLIDEAPILQLIKDIQTAHEQVATILAPLERQAYHIAYLLDDEIRRRGNMPPYTDTAYPNTLSGLLSRSTSEGISKAIIHPARSLDEYANPGYMLLGIARQLNARG